ncbi:Tetratricopeptide repeat-containing protein [Desulfatibacillum alkenivorans DSM 16219]|jgi:tetratricopeptide (TPR) repeat protein|uniref:Tetratricopeptide repeat-containing protein n=1 Tax=Desulfatibacillum alkenivorans DSM 16219 TaxID=1121393 RepID=A0A1M6S1G9_9BACT|nr:tetratricopeptide repeat protein [Desulfatibacillum alkenivorans]SHK38682.1 Tetratricopeptide repeat-containing protein [Desulfatibacillum alkenivorans DSM 16219]
MNKNRLTLIVIIVLTALAGLAVWSGLSTHKSSIREAGKSAETTPQNGNEAADGSLEALAGRLELSPPVLDAIIRSIRDHGIPPLRVHQLLLQKKTEFNDLIGQMQPSKDGGESFTPHAREVLSALNAGDFDKARSLLQKVLSELEAGTVSPDKDPDLKALTLARLGRLENLQLEYKKAADYFGQAAQAAQKDSLALKSDLYGWQGTALFLAEDFEQAEKAYKESLTLAEKAFSPVHPAQVNALNNLAGLYRSTGRPKLAEPLYLKAMDIRQKALGPRHPSLAAPLSNLASLYLEMGDYKQAVILLENALAIREEALGPDDPSVAASLNNLANVYQAVGNPDKAKELLLQSLDITRKALGPDHLRVAMTLNNLAKLSQRQGDDEGARARYLEALAISEKVLGPVHPDVAAILINLAELDMKADQLDKAEILWRKAMTILEATVGPEHPDVQKIKEQLAQIRIANAKKSIQ